MEEANSKKPQAGAWDNTKAYPKKVKFNLDQPVVVTFSKDFDVPKEMPSLDNKPDNDNNDVFYIFECMCDGVESAISTSAWTMMRSLKNNMPLAGKTLIITKKNVGGKNNFYVETPDENESRIAATPKEVPAQVDTEEAGIAEDSTM